LPRVRAGPVGGSLAQPAAYPAEPGHHKGIPARRLRRLTHEAGLLAREKRGV